MKIYISTSLANQQAAELVAVLLRDRGHEITFYWWMIDEPKTPSEKNMLSKNEIDAVKNANAVVFLPPGGRGCHMELGVALGLGIPIYGVAPVPKDSAMFYSLFKWVKACYLAEELEKLINE